MDSSSENSFAWTDTSNDSVDSNRKDVTKEKTHKNAESSHNPKRKDKKKPLSRTISHEDLPNELKIDIKDEQSNCDIKSNNSIKKKKIKLEQESDNDLKKKKKKIRHIDVNGKQNSSQDISYDETYLDMKVKEEETSASFSKKKKQKNKKRHTSSESTIAAKINSRENDEYNSSSETNDGNVTLKQESGHETDSTKSKKKKKKKKKKYDSDDHNIEVEDKMDIGETVVNKPEQTHNILSTVNQTVTENYTFQEESEESGGEISAIKCDNDQNIHTISFVNKENKNKLCSDGLTENIIRSQHYTSRNSAEHDLNKKSVRKPRISDRIQFEDEDDTNIESSKFEESDHEHTKRSSKLKQFVKTNPNLKQVSQKFHSNLSLTLNDEIWILKCPKEIDIEAFNNTTLDIHAKCKIKVGGKTYDGCAEEEQLDTITLLTSEYNHYKIKNLPLSGIINLRKRIPKAHFRDDNIMVNNQTNFIPLPETKCRHPLFGANYKKALKIPPAIANRLNVHDDEESTIKAGKRKKKKSKKDKNISEQVDSQLPSILKMESEPDLTMEVSEKRKKKRKIVDEEGPIPKKVKRIKHDPESAEAWESEKAIEENLFNF